LLVKLWRRASNWLTGRQLDAGRMPPWVFWVQLIWLLALLALFLIFTNDAAFRHALPHSYGRIPVEVPWFGALGGSLVSFTGIFNHNRKGLDPKSVPWDPKYNIWHAVRPLIGASTAGVGCVLLLLTLRAATTGTVTTDSVTFDEAAFVFGYAESAFRQLVGAVTNALFKPSNV